MSQLDHVNRIYDSDGNYVKYISEMMKHFRDDLQHWWSSAKKQNKLRQKKKTEALHQKGIPVNSLSSQQAQSYWIQ